MLTFQKSKPEGTHLVFLGTMCGSGPMKLNTIASYFSGWRGERKTTKVNISHSPKSWTVSSLFSPLSAQELDSGKSVSSLPQLPRDNGLFI